MLPKKRKSDVHIDACSHENADGKSQKWYESDHNGENRRNSKGGAIRSLFKRAKSSMNLRKSHSTSKLEPVMDDTLMSINSESSVTSAESGPSSLVPNIARNSMLRTFVNRDSCTPVPPPDGGSALDTFDMPSVGGLKQESLNKMEDSLSISSHMSIDTIGSSHAIEEDSMSIGSASAYCTPSRNPLQRTFLRTSTRSVPGFRADSDDDHQPALFRSLCNSAVRRPNNKAEFAAPMRRSMRMSIQKRNVSSMNMADVPEEEEAVPVAANSSMRVSEPIQEEEEQFGAAKDFFDKNITSHDESADEGTSSISRLSTTSESRASAAGFSIVSDSEKGRKNSFFRKVFSGKSEGGKERRMSDVFHGLQSSASKDRRSSMVSFTNDCSFTGGGVGATSNSNVSVSSIASSDSAKKPKMRKKAPSTSNLTQRLSSVFRRSSSSTVKDDDLFGTSNTTTSSRRNTLTGYSSISSGIGSIASAASDQGYGTIGSRNGQSISRSGSKRDDEMKRERTRRMIDRIIISDVPAPELLKMKAEQMRKHDEKEIDGTREKEPDESNFLDFDVVAVDLKPDGTPFSTTAATFVDESLGRLVKEEIRSNYRPDRCGSITDHHPELVFVIPEPPSQPNMGKLNDSISSNDVTSDLLRNVRSGLHKAIEEWKKITSDRNASTMLIYPMFCQSEDEWDSKATIDSMFMMLDSILMNAKRWKPNGKCILAGITASNVRLLQEKYEDLRQSVATATSTDSVDGPLSSTYDDLDTQSITSNSTMFGAKMM